MTKRMTRQEIQQLDRLPRMHLMNTIPGIKNACLIGTQDRDGNTNLAIFNSIVHIGANPPYLGFILRPLTVHRQTYDNLKTTGAFTLNMVTRDMVQAAHQTSAKYKPGESEFAATGLTPLHSDTLAAPYVSESPVRLGLTFQEEQHIKANNTWLIVGAVEEIYFPEEAQLESGHIALENLDTVGVAGLDSYYGLELLERLAYARPA
jgi:flavin reductase (DIM6/NTAB) family NADH-FMN oxidoreductase RutF